MIRQDKDPAKDANEALLQCKDLEAMIAAAKRLPDNRIMTFTEVRNMVVHDLHKGETCVPLMANHSSGCSEPRLTVCISCHGSGRGSSS
jgi:hypothetical protein